MTGFPPSIEWRSADARRRYASERTFGSRSKNRVDAAVTNA
jgi:hypothetical protein